MSTMTPLPEGFTEVLSLAMAGDDKAREEVFYRMRARLGAIVARFAQRLRRPDLLTVTGVIDVALGKALEPGARNYPSEGAFYTYCTRIIRSVCLEFLRAMSAQKRGPEMIHVSADEVLLRDDPDWLIVEERLTAATALEQLGEENPLLATIIHLWAGFGMSDREIAERLKMKRSNVQKQRHVALLRLKSLVDSAGSRGPTGSSHRNEQE